MEQDSKASSNLHLYIQQNQNFFEKSSQQQKKYFEYFPKCIKNNQSSFLCCQKNCKQPAIVCGNSTCQCQINKHSKCHFIKTHEITKNLTNRQFSKANIETINLVQSLYNKIIEQISIEKEIAIFKLQNYGYGEHQLKLKYFFEKYQNEEWNIITGDLISKVQVQTSKTFDNRLIQEQDNLKDLKESYSLYYDELKQFTKKIDHMVFNFLSVKRPFPSKIVVSQKEQNIVKKFLGKPVNNFQLLYRATDQDFRIKKFHQAYQQMKSNQCTLVLAETVIGKKLMAYTSIKWQATGNYISENLFSSYPKTFIASITNQQKYDLIEKTQAIATKEIHGPWFGRTDFSIYDNANTNPCRFKLKSFSNTDRSLQDSQEQWQKFSGAINGQNITLKECFKIDMP